MNMKGLIVHASRRPRDFKNVQNLTKISNNYSITFSGCFGRESLTSSLTQQIYI